MYQKIHDLLSQVSRIVFTAGYEAGSCTNLSCDLRFNDGTDKRKERHYFGVRFSTFDSESDKLHWTVYSSFFEDGKKFLVKEFTSYDDLEWFTYDILEALGIAGTRWCKRHLLKKGGNNNVR